MKIPSFDSLRSLLGNLGNKDRDKAAGVYFEENFLDDEQLIAAYGNSWIARKVIDIPARDALRKWRTWNSDHVEAIEAEEKRLDIKNKVLEAAIKGRLFGGAALYIGASRPNEDLSEPLNVNNIDKGGLKYLSVMTRRELMANDIGQDPQSEFYGLPMNYTITSPENTVIIHPSRIVRFTGDMHPNIWLNAGINQGWGEPVLKAVFESLRQASGTCGNIASLIFEANVDVIKMPEFMSRIGEDGYESSLLKRFQLAATGKGINGTLMLDELETYERRPANFTHLSEIMEAFILLCAGAADIPATRFMARSPGGLSSTGEGDMKNYHDRIQSIQELDIEPAMCLLDQCLLRSAGAEQDATFEWAPLEQMSEKALSEIGKDITESLVKIDDLGVYTGEEIRELSKHRLAESKAFPHIETIAAGTAAALELDDIDENDQTQGVETDD